MNYIIIYLIVGYKPLKYIIIPICDKYNYLTMKSIVVLLSLIALVLSVSISGGGDGIEGCTGT
jgi:hypothetical protein